MIYIQWFSAVKYGILLFINKYVIVLSYFYSIKMCSDNHLYSSTQPLLCAFGCNMYTNHSCEKYSQYINYISTYLKAVSSHFNSPCLVSICHPLFLNYIQYHYTPHFNEVERGYTGFTLSICPSHNLPIYPSVNRIKSVLYLQQYSPDPFHINASYQKIFKIGKYKVLQIL